MQKTALVLGGGGFIGGHLARRLESEGMFVRSVDMVLGEFGPSAADEVMIGDLRDQQFCDRVFDRTFDEVYQLAADMGGGGLYLYRRERR